MIRAALCDDEPVWLDEATRILQAYADATAIELEITHHDDADSLLVTQQLPPDVLFCDIDLAKDETGIDLAHEVNRRWPQCQVVYVTNYLRFAPDVYTTEHLWFVLKNEFERRLPEVMEKLQHQLDDGSQVLVAETTMHEVVSLPCASIVTLERHARITLVITTSGETYQIPDRLPHLLARLPQRVFARCHASFIVNMGHVRLLRADSLVMDEGTQVPVSRRFARSFRNAYLSWADDHAV